MTFPPIPSWQGLHPLVIHFSIALLFMVPVFVVLGMLFSKSARSLLTSALILSVLGTAAVYVATATGHSAGELAEKIPKVKPVLEQHEDLAETTEAVFTILSIALAGVLVVPALLKRQLSRSLSVSINVVLLVFYAGGVLWLANTAHQGARLVHELGVRAPISQAGQTIDPATRSTSRTVEDEEHRE